MDCCRSSVSCLGKSVCTCVYGEGGETDRHRWDYLSGDRQQDEETTTRQFHILRLLKVLLPPTLQAFHLGQSLGARLSSPHLQGDCCICSPLPQKHSAKIMPKLGALLIIPYISFIKLVYSFSAIGSDPIRQALTRGWGLPGDSVKWAGLERGQMLALTMEGPQDKASEDLHGWRMTCS